MIVSTLKKQSVIRAAMLDIFLLGVICIVPTLSHLFAIPFYQLNPMLFCLLTGMILVRDRRNAYLLAVLLPVVSMLVCGMPTPMKALCMVPELLTIVALFSFLDKRMPSFMAMVAAALAGKIVYYGLKALIIGPVVLVGTNMWIQLLSIALFSVLFSLASKRI